MRKFIALFFLFSFSCLGCDNATIKYFSWANLKVFPEQVSNPITKEEADKREAKGEAYYMQLICDSGEIMQLTKRWNQKVFFQIDYLGDSGKITTDINGKVTKNF